MSKINIAPFPTPPVAGPLERLRRDGEWFIDESLICTMIGDGRLAAKPQPPVSQVPIRHKQVLTGAWA